MSITQNNYFCWICKSDVTVTLPHLKCDVCGSEFVEERMDEERYSMNTGFGNLLNYAMSEEERTRATHRTGNFLNSIFDFIDRGRRRENPNNPPNQNPNERTNQIQNTLANVMSGLFASIGEEGQWEQDRVGENGVRIRRRFIRGRGGGNPRGNLGDFVSGSLDDIITRLMNEYQPTGDPPAEERDIERLQSVEINDEIASSEQKCPVCMEVYKKEETGVVKLPCDHIFHHGCVAQWLRMHDSCPVCRKPISSSEQQQLNNQQQQQQRRRN